MPQLYLTRRKVDQSWDRLSTHFGPLIPLPDGLFGNWRDLALIVGAFLGGDDLLERALQRRIIGVRADFLGGRDEPLRLLRVVRF